VSEAHFVSEHLTSDHDLDSFDSGQPELDEWLRRSALHAESIRSGRTWVWTQAGAVLAYFTLAGHVIEREALPRQLGRGSPDRIPAVLIARLALDRAHHGQGLGGVLLADASTRIVAATELVAARFIVVDAIDDSAANFYNHHGYQPLPDTRRLVRKLSDVAHDLGNS
jgi:GNAT superfamily N-acetyltransferase